MSNQDQPAGDAPEPDHTSYQQTLILIAVAIVAAIVAGVLMT